MSVLSSFFKKFKNFFFNIGFYFYLLKPDFLKLKKEDEFIIAPCVGDIIEFEDGSRTMVASVDIENEKYDVRFFCGTTKCVNQRGRQKTLVEVSDSCEAWPPENSKIYRDSMLIHPSKAWKVSFINWLSKKLLK